MSRCISSGVVLSVLCSGCFGSDWAFYEGEWLIDNVAVSQGCDRPENWDRVDESFQLEYTDEETIRLSFGPTSEFGLVWPAYDVMCTLKDSKVDKSVYLNCKDAEQEREVEGLDAVWTRNLSHFVLDYADAFIELDLMIVHACDGSDCEAAATEHGADFECVTSEVLSLSSTASLPD